MAVATTHALHTFMAQLSDEMASEYARIYARASDDPGTAGDEGEANWAALFREWLPPTYQVETKGRIIGHDGRLSPQIDVLILKPTYPLKLREKKLWLAGGVAAAFECKTTLGSSHLAEAFGRCQKFKSLFPERQGSPRKELRSPLIYGLLAHSHVWKSERSSPLENIEKHWRGGQPVDHPRFELDLVCVADLACWSGMYLAGFPVEMAGSSDEAAAYEKEFGGKIGPMTAFNCAAYDSQDQYQDFRPVGALIAALTRRIAAEDAAVRDIADYYDMANLGGQNRGTLRTWPLDVYSADVRPKVERRQLINGEPWDEWSLYGL
ncbi:DUF6602 domain-containing protein [Afifella aestuarii]|uniref:DUF6602 domain-containing protein n=1 Tax=Afifella aestuarii TaxID=1909496 RepID=UPI000FE3E3E2|nr:DUF6602 domain-containing protein [Afifella aestuarii]